MAAVTHEAHEIADEAAFGIQIGPKLVPLQYVVNDALSFAKAILLGLTLTLAVAVLLLGLRHRPDLEPRPLRRRRAGSFAEGRTGGEPLIPKR